MLCLPFLTVLTEAFNIVLTFPIKLLANPTEKRLKTPSQKENIGFSSYLINLPRPHYKIVPE